MCITNSVVVYNLSFADKVVFYTHYTYIQGQEEEKKHGGDGFEKTVKTPTVEGIENRTRNGKKSFKLCMTINWSNIHYLKRII